MDVCLVGLPTWFDTIQLHVQVLFRCFSSKSVVLVYDVVCSSGLGSGRHISYSSGLDLDKVAPVSILDLHLHIHRLLSVMS